MRKKLKAAGVLLLAFALLAGVLSFYYLAVKRGDAGTSVGKMFAMICGREGDEAYIRRGTEIYGGFAALALSKIEEYGLGCDGAAASRR